MSTPPERQKIYHITHLENVPQMVDGVIWSDAERIRQGLPCKVVGMSEIKRRRLEELEVDCHRGTMVGQYVPFYFCFRSIMLYILHRGNAEGLSYQGGQRPMVHFEADLNASLAWARNARRRWAFSKGNAGAYYTRFFSDTELLRLLDWKAIEATDWRDPDAKEGKQAECLIEEKFPWSLVERIGVIDDDMAERVRKVLNEAEHQPEVIVARNWYY